MKFIALASLLVLTIGQADADHFATLAGYRDSIRLEKGQAALVTFVADTPVLQYRKVGRPPVQIHLGNFLKKGRSKVEAHSRRLAGTASAHDSLTLAGPATLQLMTDGLVSLRVLRNENPVSGSRQNRR